jgi:hypothetical protein
MAGSGFLSADIANQALDAIGRSSMAIGDLEEGTDAARILLRAYPQCMRQLLRSAHWNWARRQTPLLLLADASGNTPNVGTNVPQGWLYSYASPQDNMKSRFVPWNTQNQATAIPSDNIQIPSTPQVTGMGNQPVPMRPRPAKFLEATDYNNLPPSPGIDTPGVSPIGRTVILTNVREATLVYTCFNPYPQVWDALFRAAMVAYLASEVALAMWEKDDKVFGLRVREAQEAIVRGKVTEARLVDGNVGTYTSDIAVDWMRTRYSGGPGLNNVWGAGAFGGGDGDGVYGYGYDSLPLASGAVF